LGNELSTVAHYGNVFDETEYETEYSTLYANLQVQATKKVGFDFSGFYSQSEAEFDALQMYVDIDPLYTGSVPGDHDYTEIDTYSDLDQTVYEVRVEGDWQLSRAMAIFSGVAYSHLEDKEPYVYGDLDGSWVYSRLGLRILF
jgi:hypothetical protein